jgi:hypothetical protein
MSASHKAIPGGQPSTMQPIAAPCDSPNEVTVNNVPKVFPDIDYPVEKMRKDAAQFNIDPQPN